MKNQIKIYLDNNHLINLLDSTNSTYAELAGILKKNSQIKILISGALLTEQANVAKATMLARANAAEMMTFSYLRNYETLIKMELANFLTGKAVKPETDNFFNVIKLPHPWLVSHKEKKLKFPDLLKILPERPLPEQNDWLYNILTGRDYDQRNINQLIMEYIRSKKTGVSESALKNLNEFSCAPLFFYLFSWLAKVKDTTKTLSRNDAFDSAHCTYIPYADYFVTDRGNAHCAKQAMKRYNMNVDMRCNSIILKDCVSLLTYLKKLN
jgi:hypothetical protein